MASVKLDCGGNREELGGTWVTVDVPSMVLCAFPSARELRPATIGEYLLSQAADKPPIGVFVDGKSGQLVYVHGSPTPRERLLIGEEAAMVDLAAWPISWRALSEVP